MPSREWQDHEAHTLAQYIRSLDGFREHLRPRRAYDHMGAVIADTALQPGLRYDTVVAPRVRRLVEVFPEARTTSGFWRITVWLGTAAVLEWSHPEKPRRVEDLTDFFRRKNLETAADVRDWLLKPRSRQALLQVRGVGPKTVDYLSLLVGLSRVAVDRHVRSFVVSAGIADRTYDEVQEIVNSAAELLNVRSCDLDGAIWSYVSSSTRTHRNETGLLDSRA